MVLSVVTSATGARPWGSSVLGDGVGAAGHASPRPRGRIRLQRGDECVRRRRSNGEALAEAVVQVVADLLPLAFEISAPHAPALLLALRSRSFAAIAERAGELADFIPRRATGALAFLPSAGTLSQLPEPCSSQRWHSPQCEAQQRHRWKPSIGVACVRRPARPR